MVARSTDFQRKGLAIRSRVSLPKLVSIFCLNLTAGSGKVWLVRDAGIVEILAY